MVISLNGKQWDRSDAERPAPIMISTSYTMPAKRFISQGEMSVSFLGGFSAPVGARSETARPPILAGSTLCAPREKLEGREAREAARE
jgi:hypothetical protein